MKRAQLKRSEPDIDLDAAKKFLRLLDRNAEAFTFQTFDDRKPQDARLARVLHGSLVQHADELADLNRRGACIGVTMNETDLKGTKRENVVRVRAVVLDLDDPDDVEAVARVKSCSLRPHCIVETSPGRYHVYWLVSEGDGVVLNEFEDVQRAIAAAFDGDPAVALLTHRARLPGFLHNKREPRLAQVTDWWPQRSYDWSELLAQFPPREKPHKPSGSAVMLPKGDHVAAAQALLDAEFCRDNLRTMVAHRGDYYEWTGSHYEKLGRRNLTSTVYEFLHRCRVVESDGMTKPYNPARAKVGEVLAALEAGVNHDENRDPPFWLPPINRDAGRLIACRNGLLDIETGQLEPHDQYFFNVNCLPFEFDPEARAPGWSAFLRTLWPDDKEARLALREWFGYFLTADTSQQKIFMLIGPKRAGKGTIARVLTALLGRDSVANPTLGSLGGEFGLWPLINKRVAIVSDARIGNRADKSLVAERLLSISGEDALTVNRKYLSHWTGRPGTRFLILSNELPSIKDASQALASRFVLLTLRESFYGREDVRLEDKLRAELPGILNWSLRGLKRLRERGHFRIPTSSVEVVRQLEDLSSPVGAFLREWCKLSPEASVNNKLLYGAWKAWCEARGEKAGSSAVFGKDLRAAAPHIRTRSSGEKRYYQGVGLSDHGRERYDAIGER